MKLELVSHTELEISGLSQSEQDKTLAWPAYKADQDWRRNIDTGTLEIKEEPDSPPEQDKTLAWSAYEAEEWRRNIDTGTLEIKEEPDSPPECHSKQHLRPLQNTKSSSPDEKRNLLSALCGRVTISAWGPASSQQGDQSYSQAKKRKLRSSLPDKMSSSSISDSPSKGSEDVRSSETIATPTPNGSYRSRVLKGLVSWRGGSGQQTTVVNGMSTVSVARNKAGISTRLRWHPGTSQATNPDDRGKTAADQTAGVDSTDYSGSAESSPRLSEEMECSDADSDAGSTTSLSDKPCAAEAGTVTPLSKTTRGPKRRLDREVRQIHGVAISGKPNKRVWDRSNVCPFCEKPSLKLSRHMARRHRQEVEVQDVLKLAKHSKERREAFQLLVNKGNYIHNMKVKRGLKNGALIPARRMRTVGNGSVRRIKDFVACEYCKGFYPRSLISRHKIAAHKTPAGGSDIRAETEPRVPVDGQELRTPKSVLDATVCDGDDDVTVICKGDPLILRFGEWLQTKLGDTLHPSECISSKMMAIGRLVKTFRVNNRGASLSDLLTTGKFSQVVDCVRLMSPCPSKILKCGILSLAVELGPCLARCATLLKESLIDKGQDVSKVSNFLQWYRRDWMRQISRGALLFEDEDDEEPMETESQQSCEDKRREEVRAIPKQSWPAVPGKVVHRSWSYAERAAVIRQLGEFLKDMRVPGKEACERAIAAERALENRPWRDVKYCVNNMLQAVKREAGRCAGK